MKYLKLNIVNVTILVSLQLFAQGDLEVDGKIKVGHLDTISSTSYVVTRNANGNLALIENSEIHPVENAHELPLTSNYLHYGVGYQAGMFYRHDERVFMDGLLRKQTGVVENGDVLCVLPPNYRPLMRTIAFGRQGHHAVRINIEPNGNVVIISGALTGSAAIDWIGIDNISFTLKDFIPIGLFIEGGHVFYLADPPVDLNGDGTPDRGLVAAPSSSETGEYNWGCCCNDAPGGDGLAIGHGAQNTADHVADCSNANSPAVQCSNLVWGGYDDWFLPSRQELIVMENELGGAENIGGFFNDNYWSSSESNINAMHCVNFEYGGVGICGKLTSNRIRAIRAF